jgi:hypothetical protein
LLTTGPLGGGVNATVPASHPDSASLDCGWAQKNWCEYSRLTARPLNHARVNPILSQPGPPALQDRGVDVPSPAASAKPNVSVSTVATIIVTIAGERMRRIPDHLVIVDSFG